MKALIYVHAIDPLVRRWTSPRLGFARSVALEIPRDNDSRTRARRVGLINVTVPAGAAGRFDFSREITLNPKRVYRKSYAVVERERAKERHAARYSLTRDNRNRRRSLMRFFLRYVTFADRNINEDGSGFEEGRDIRANLLNRDGPFSFFVNSAVVKFSTRFPFHK